MTIEKAVRFLLICVVPALVFSNGRTMEPLTLFGETPGEFRPKPIRNPAQEAGNTGLKIQPADTLPRSRGPFTDPVPKPRRSYKETPTIRGNELVFDAGWKLIEAKRAGGTGAALSQPGVDTHDW